MKKTLELSIEEMIVVQEAVYEALKDCEFVQSFDEQYGEEAFSDVMNELKHKLELDEFCKAHDYYKLD